MVQIQESELRAQAFDSTIKQQVERLYKFKQALAISTTAAWMNTYYQETTTSALTGQPNNAIRGVPRLANFPTNSVEFNPVNKWQEKYAFEDVIAWEDILTDQIDVQSRTLFRISEGITNAVDTQIYTDLTDTSTWPDINRVRIATTLYWDGNSAAIIDDLGQAVQLIAEDDYETAELICFINPKDRRSINTYLAAKGAQFPQLGNEAAVNGRVGRLNGINFVVANNVTASQALVVVPKLCATWKTAYPLTTETLTDPLKSVKIRAVEIGATHVTDPKAICLITGTQGAF